MLPRIQFIGFPSFINNPITFNKGASFTLSVLVQGTATFNGPANFYNPVQFLGATPVNITPGIQFNGQTTLNNYLQGTWTPSFTGLTVVNGTGTVTYAGRYTRIGNLVFWEVTINPSGTATTASVAGTTKITNLPFTASSPATCQVVDGAGINSYGNGLVGFGTVAYTPNWAAANVEIVITGMTLI